MKELSIEEKAKRYDEAIEIAKSKIKNDKDHVLYEDDVIEIFPELAELEDERIRKELLLDIPKVFPHDKAFRYIVYLEKQGEKKSLDDIAKEVTKDKDAAMSFLKSCGIINANGELADEYKIEQGEQKSEEVDNLHNYLYGEQKPAEWSEEDESHIRYLIECLEHCKKGVALTMTTSTSQEYINWLKALRPQNAWKPSDEQMRVLDLAIRCGINRGTTEETTLVSLFNDLKKLK